MSKYEEKAEELFPPEERSGVAALEIITDSDDPRLREPANPVEQHPMELLRQMMEFTVKGKHLGVAAPQFGIPLKCFIAMMEKNRYVAVINPRLIRKGRQMVDMYENCLSEPGKRVLISRPRLITVEFEGQDGVKIRVELKDLYARIFLHELDHLYGVLMVDREESPFLPEESGMIQWDEFSQQEAAADSLKQC